MYVTMIWYPGTTSALYKCSIGETFAIEILLNTPITAIAYSTALNYVAVAGLEVLSIFRFVFFLVSSGYTALKI